MSTRRKSDLRSLVLACALVCACDTVPWSATATCSPDPTSDFVSAPTPVRARPAPPPVHLRQLGHEFALTESPPAHATAWDPAGLTGRVIVRQSHGSGVPGYAWGVKVETVDGAPLLLQPLPMRTRFVGLTLASGDYVISTYRHGCVDGCARVTAPVRHCRTQVHVEADGLVDLGESAPDRSCRLLHRPPPAEPALASVGVRHVSSDTGPRGWVLRVSQGDAGLAGETEVALAPSVDVLTLWVDAGVHTLHTREPGPDGGPTCLSTVTARLGDAIELVHTHGRDACRPYPTQEAPVVSAFDGAATLTPAGR